MIDKPTGLLSVKGIGLEKIDCVAVRVASAVEGSRIVHRLDRDTSGVMVLAKDADTHRNLSMQFQDRNVKKEYYAIVGGEIVGDEGMIDIPIRKDLDHPPKQCVDHEQGKASQTRWKVLRRGEDQTLLILNPLTGRSHQLRIHLRELGHPILGDDLYATQTYCDRAPRLMLHSTQLIITHPVSKEELVFDSPCPFMSA